MFTKLSKALIKAGVTHTITRNKIEINPKCNKNYRYGRYSNLPNTSLVNKILNRKFNRKCM